jgi:hypothetical protein
VAFADSHREDELEDWISGSSDILGEKLLIVARQLPIPDVGRLDLLAIDSSGSLVIIELKRGMTPREAVAQALDYASWLNSRLSEEIVMYADQYLQRNLGDPDVSLAAAFEDTFGSKLQDLVCQNHRILLVGAGLDESAERIINYLVQRHSVEINAVFFNYCELSDGKQILTRSMLVADSVTPPKQGTPRVTVESLLVMARDNKTIELVNVCRQMGAKGLWEEEPVVTAQGSFRYWPWGTGRMVYGVNVSGKLANSPPGELDVWLRLEKLADLTHQSETGIQQILAKFEPFSAGKMDFVIRLKSLEEAQALIAILKDLALRISQSKMEVA